MRRSQLKRLQKLEKQIGDDSYEFRFSEMEKIYEECPDIAAVRDELEDYIVRHGPEPPRYFQYLESEGSRRWLWSLQTDKRAQAIFQRLSSMVEQETERRGVQREKEAKENHIKNWEWRRGAPEREAKAAAEREERRRKREEERLERERKWQEEQASYQQPYGGSTNRWLNDG